MTGPEFSIIIPAYNSEKYIRHALESIRTQRYQGYELIVVCDSCYDRTGDVAREYGARVIERQYGHDGLSRNAGIEAASGEWLLFMDDDDWWTNDCVLETLHEVAGKHDEDAVMFGFVWECLGCIRQTPERITPHCWDKCWRRTFVADTRFSIRPNWSDLDFTRLNMRKMKRAVFINEPMYYHSDRKNSITNMAINGQIKGAFV